jgi:hypothetical protein
MSIFLYKPFHSIFPKNFFDLTLQSPSSNNYHLSNNINNNNTNNNNTYDNNNDDEINDNNNNHHSINKMEKEVHQNYYQETMYSSQTNGQTEMCKIILFPNMKITINAVSDKSHEKFYITFTFQIQSSKKMYKMHYIVSYTDLLTILKWNKPDDFLEFIKTMPQSSSNHFKKSILKYSNQGETQSLLSSRPISSRPKIHKKIKHFIPNRNESFNIDNTENMNNSIQANMNNPLNMDNNGKNIPSRKIKKLKPHKIIKKKIQTPLKSSSTTPKIYAKTYKKTVKRPSTKLIRRKYTK